MGFHCSFVRKCRVDRCHFSNHNGCSRSDNTSVCWSRCSGWIDCLIMGFRSRYAKVACDVESAAVAWVFIAHSFASAEWTAAISATITDVLDPTTLASAGRDAPAGSIVSLWGFDPDTRKLRVTLNPPQSHGFSLLIRSQVPSGPLPFEQTVGLISVENAAGQIGLLGIATGNEVQLDNVNAQGF